MILLLILGNRNVFAMFIASLFCCFVGMAANLDACNIIAHRGASAEAPENTLAAVNLAWEQNSDIVEFDIHLTKDEEIVVTHDEDTKRITGKKLKIKNTNYAELSKLDVGSFFGEEFKGETIPTLAQVLATVPEGKKVAIEVKCKGNIVKRLAEEIEKSGLTNDQIMVISFEYDVVSEFKKQYPHREVCLLQTMRRHLITRKWKTSAEDIVEKLVKANLDGCIVKAVSAVDARFIRTVKSSGFKFFLYTIDDLSQAEKYMKLNVDGFATNCPAKMLELRSQVW